MEVNVTLHNEEFIMLEFTEGALFYGVPLNWEECLNLSTCLEECLHGGKLELMVDTMFIKIGSTMRHVIFRFYNYAPVLGVEVSRRQADKILDSINQILKNYSVGE